MLKNDRRKFIRDLSAISIGAVTSSNFLSCATRLDSKNEGAQGKNLVVIQLAGGNDGLNTFVPYRNDIYFKNRPNVALQKKEIIAGSGQYDIGFNQALSPIVKLYDKGMLSVVNGVGYKDPIRSHFRASDIWHSGTKSSEFIETGWLGRVFDHAPYHDHIGVAIEDSLPPILKGQHSNSLAFTDINRLYSKYKALEVNQFNQLNDIHASENYRFLVEKLTQTKKQVENLKQYYKTFTPKSSYPPSKLGKDLAIVSNLIKSDTSIAVYFLTIGGFDSHANQKVNQAKRLSEYSLAVDAFVKDMKANGLMKDTLIFTFSEFGRRVRENGSKGTDHGTANSAWFIGESLKKQGFYNALPSLANTVGNDLVFQIDYRRLYVDILEHWLGVSYGTVISDPKNELKGLGLL